MPDATNAFSQVAARLRDAYHRGPVAPLRDDLAPLDAAGAYQVQQINTRFWQQAGRRIAGRKIGLTAKAVQVQLGVDQPDYGVLFADMEVTDGGTLAPAAMLQPKVEGEVALIMGRDLDNPAATAEDMRTAVDYAIAAIEVVDSRIADWRITFADTVADNGSAGRFVLGSERRSLAGLDLYTCGMALQINGSIASVGAGAACLGNPLHAAAWLARALSRLGEGLKAGDILLTGALGPMMAITPGDEIEVQIGGLGAVRFSYR